MEPICKLKDIYKALYNFEKEFSENSGITINEGMVLCSMKDDGNILTFFSINVIYMLKFQE